MHRIRVRPLFEVIVACVLLMLCRNAHSQNVTVKWPKQPVSQPAAQASPQPKTKNSQKSGVVDRRPLIGSIVGRTYTNKFFHFSIEFPEGWIAIWINEGPKEGPKGVAYALLLVASPDKRMNGTRWINIAAVRPRDSGLSAQSAQRALENEANGLNSVTSMGLGRGFRPIGKPSEVLLGGRRMTRLHVATEVDVRGVSYDTRGWQLALVERGYLLMFISSDPVGRESDASSAVKALDSLRFSAEDPAAGR